MNRISEVNSIDDKRFIFNNEQNQINLTYGQIDNTRRRAFYWGNPITKLAELEDLNDSFVKGFGVDIKTFIKIITNGFYYIKDKEILWCNNAIFIGNGCCPHSSNMIRTHYLHSETDSNMDKILKDQHYWDWTKEEDVFCFEDYNKTWSIDRKILENDMAERLTRKIGYEYEKAKRETQLLEINNKLGKLEDILEKYGIESVEELDEKLNNSISPKFKRSSIVYSIAFKEIEKVQVIAYLNKCIILCRNLKTRELHTIHCDYLFETEQEANNALNE